MRTVDDTGEEGFSNFLNFFLEDSCGYEKFGDEKKSEE